MGKKVGIMTGGGDCPGLNAVIRAVVLKARSRGWEVLGVEDATEGLLDLEYRSPHGNRWLVERDVDASVRWYRAAADQKVVQAMFNLALIYEQGELVERDIDEAMGLYTKLRRASNLTVVLDRKGKSITKDISIR